MGMNKGHKMPVGIKRLRIKTIDGHRRCKTCKVMLPLSDYHCSNAERGWYMGECNKCRNERGKEYYHLKMKDPAFVEKEKRRSKEKRERLGKNWKRKTTEQKRERRIKYENMYPERATIHRLTLRKLGSRTDGKHYHHWSYNKQHIYDVMVLTRQDHVTLHRFIRYDQPTKMYRTLDGELLDTLERHQEYYNKVINQLAVA